MHSRTLSSAYIVKWKVISKCLKRSAQCEQNFCVKQKCKSSFDSDIQYDELGKCDSMIKKKKKIQNSKLEISGKLYGVYKKKGPFHPV